MKLKPLMAIALSVGLLPTVLAEDPTPTYYWTWTADGVNSSTTGWGGNFNYTNGNDYAIFGPGNTYKPFSTSIGFTGSFTLEFSFRNPSGTDANQPVVAMYSKAGQTGGNYSLQLRFNSDGKLGLYDTTSSFGTTASIPAGASATCVAVGTTLSATEWTQYSIVADTTAKTLSLYVDGTLSGQYTNWEPGSVALTGMQFGKAFGNGNGSFGKTIEVNNIRMYGAAIHPTPAVPEPATATLSLLALAGLAARRRRK